MTEYFNEKSKKKFDDAYEAGRNRFSDSSNKSSSTIRKSSDNNSKPSSSSIIIKPSSAQIRSHAVHTEIGKSPIAGSVTRQQKSPDAGENK